MSSGKAVMTKVVSRIGERRQVIIPKRVFDALKLRTGDFVEVTTEGGRLHMRPKRLVDIGDEGLSASDAVKIRKGESEIKARHTESWRTVKDELGR
jgi:AbrB family looped-hinge helix DNA binding protein